MIRLKFSCLIALVLLSAAWAAPLTLKQAEESALKNNPDLASARTQWEAAKAKVPQSLSLADLEIGLEYEQIPSGSRNLEDGMKMYTAKQMITFPGKIYAEWQMANSGAKILAARYAAKKLEILSQTRAAYYDLFLADRSIGAISEIKELLARAKRTAESRYVTGKVSQADVLQANIELLLMENDLLTLNQERAAKEARLKSLIILLSNETIEPEEKLSFGPVLSSYESYEKAALAGRPALLAMKAELEMKDSAQLRAKMEYLPDLDLKAKKRVGDGWDAMFALSVPLYFWKQGYGLAAAGFEREAAEADYRNMQNMTRWEVREAYIMAEAAGRSRRLYEKSILPQSQQAIKIGLSAYSTGQIDLQSLLLIEKMYKEARLKYYESQANFGKALAELEKIIGGEIK